LTAHDFGTLLPSDFGGAASGWLNDDIVNKFLSVIIEKEQQNRGYVKSTKKSPPVHAYASQWWTTVNKPKGCENLTKWSKRAHLQGRQLLHADLILFPICESSHWTLLAVRPKDRSIEYLDSLSGNHARYLNKVREYIGTELGDLYIAGEWKEITHRSSRQNNSNDCGVFTLFNAFALLRGRNPGEAVQAEDMPDARRQIAATLLQGDASGEF
ncbi:cysteine proteinase, partial [Lepidopterella palustris CBS 459.81]